MTDRITTNVTVQTRKGPKVIERNGTLTGETSAAGMLRVQWDNDGYGQMGWVAPAEVERDADYIDMLALAVEIVADDMVDLGESDRDVDSVPDIITDVRTNWPSLVTDEIREGQNGHAWLEVIDALNTDLARAYAVLRERAEGTA